MRSYPHLHGLKGVKLHIGRMQHPQAVQHRGEGSVSGYSIVQRQLQTIECGPHSAGPAVECHLCHTHIVSKQLQIKHARHDRVLGMPCSDDGGAPARALPSG